MASPQDSTPSSVNRWAHSSYSSGRRPRSSSVSAEKPTIPRSVYRAATAAHHEQKPQSSS